MVAARTHILETEEARFGSQLILPAVSNIVLSFSDIKLVDANTYIGLAKYREVIRYPTFRSAVLITLIYVLATTAGTTLVGLGVTLLMNQEFPLLGLVRGLILLPHVAPVIAVFVATAFNNQEELPLHLFDDDPLQTPGH